MVLEVKSCQQRDPPPIAWLIIEREEQYVLDPDTRHAAEAHIKLSYQRIVPTRDLSQIAGGEFLGYYQRSANAVSLTSASLSRGAVFLDLPGLDGNRIGTYLMNEIVLWVMQWPEATVRPIELVSGQGGDENKERRNRFYEQFNLRFVFEDNEKRAGLSIPMPVRELTPVEHWKQNIREISFMEYLAQQLQSEQLADIKLRQLERANSDLVAEQRRVERTPFRWMLQLYWWRYRNLLIGCSAGVLLGLLYWLRS